MQILHTERDEPLLQGFFKLGFKQSGPYLLMSLFVYHGADVILFCTSWFIYCLFVNTDYFKTTATWFSNYFQGALNFKKNHMSRQSSMVPTSKIQYNLQIST